MYNIIEKLSENQLSAIFIFIFQPILTEKNESDVNLKGCTGLIFNKKLLISHRLKINRFYCSQALTYLTKQYIFYSFKCYFVYNFFRLTYLIKNSKSINKVILKINFESKDQLEWR
jgi:hypothetical protein